MRELNKKKETGKYDELQKQYNARYEATPYGMQRRKEYREKQKDQRATATTRKINPMNRLRVGMRHKICDIMARHSQAPISVGAAMQYIGVTGSIMKNWVAFNFDEGMTWDNLGTVWKLELVGPAEGEGLVMTEKDKFDTFNWRNWCPTRIGAAPRNLREQSVAFLAS